MDVGSCVVALFDFDTTEPGELALTAGDAIEITGRVDENWIEGTCNGRSGTFPANFVRPAEADESGYEVRAIQNITGQLAEELTFMIGDIITITEKVDEDWLRGTFNGTSGILPASCVQALDSNSLNGPKAGTAPSNADLRLDNAFPKDSTAVGDPPKARTLYPFSAERDGELSFMDGETINLRKRIDKQWLEGELDGNVGLFPAEFVEILVDIPPGYVPPEVKLKSGSVKQGSSSSSNPVLSAGPQGDVAVVKPQLLDIAQAKGASPLKGRRAKVLYDFNPETEHDLSAKQGDLVTIVTKPDNDWYEAQSAAGKIGFIPIAYVQLLEKPRTPSFKRQAPQPPGAKPSKKSDAPSVPQGAPADKNANELFPVGELENRGSHKPSQGGGGGGALDDLLFFDPLGGGSDVPLAPAAPHPSGAPDPALPHAFKLGGSSFKPVSFAGKSSANTATVAPMSVTPPPTAPTPPPQPKRGNSLLDMSPVDKPMSPILLPMAPVSAGGVEPEQPTSKTPMTKQESLDSLSKFDILAARPFNPTSSKQIRSVQRPVNRGSSSSSIDASAAVQATAAPSGGSEPVNNPPQGSELLTISQINQDLDRAMLEGTSPNMSAGSGLLTLSQVNSDLDRVIQESGDTATPNFNAAFSNEMTGFGRAEPEFCPPVPPRQPSPNPFAAAVEEQQAAESLPTTNPSSSNPFAAVSPPADSETTFSNAFDPLQPYVESQLPRDDSIPSDMSDDAFAQGINFTINSPLSLPQTAPTSSTFKLPPPPSPGKRPIAPPKPQKFDPRTAVPRPRPRNSVENMEAVILMPPPPAQKPVLLPKPDFDLLSSTDPAANPELANFEASVQQIFDTTQWDTDEVEAVEQRPKPPAPLTRGASLLEQDLGVISQVLQQQSRGSQGQAVVGDLLGIGGVEETQPPAPQTNKPSRPAPARPALPAKKKVPPGRPLPPRLGPKGEEDMLAHLRPEGAVNGEAHSAIAEMEARIADITEQIENLRGQKSNLVRECAFVTIEGDKAELQQQIADTDITILQKEEELHSLEAQLADLKPQPAPAPKMTPADFREKVLRELLKTEEDYVRDIKLCQEGFMTVLQENQAKGLELDVLFGNMEQVIEVAESFMSELESTASKPVEEQLVGKVFMDHSMNLHEAYAQYCRNHDDASALLEKYEENPEVQEYINQGLELVRQSTNCWDLASFLIKPVQRILKYHLLIAELYKYTEEDHQDRATLKLALAKMTEVATDINEFKRRKDLVLKYRHRGQEAITDKLGKLNLHSIRKKSQRINQRFTQMTGLGTQTIDDDFEKAERRFNTLEKTIKIFVKDVHAYLEQLKEATSVEATVGSDISDYYANQSNLHEVNKYEAVQNHLANKLYKDYTLFVQQRVMSPLHSLLIMFQGPQKLIQKRYDKLLDYDSYINKAEKNKDKERVKQVKDEKEVARKNYEALNTQLKDELPQLCTMAMTLFKSCVISFIEAERDHINSTLKKLYPLIELSIVKSNDMMSIMADFETSHQQASEAMMVYNFVPRNFDRRVDKSDKKSRKPFNQPNVPTSKPPSSKAQSESQRQGVLTRYAPGRIFRVKTDFIAQQPMDISVYKGNVVGIIKEQDPTGSSDRWYVDSGASQGFLPMSILVAYSNESQGNIYSSDDEANRGLYSDLSSPQYYYAEWAFTATSANELTLTEGAVVTVISAQDSEGNSEWWLVEKDGEQGYIPSAYLARV